jgi:aminocarboxymuconate-semialdehyde decarboxylase
MTTESVPRPTSSPARPGTPVIDVHAHAVPDGVARAAQQGTWHGLRVAWRGEDVLELVTLSGRRHVLPWTRAAQEAEHRLAAMDKLGIDVHVLSLMPSMYQYGLEGHDTVGGARECNDDFIELATAHPDRFRVFAHLPLDSPAQAVAELERCMASEVVVGAVVGTHVQGRNWDDPGLFKVLEAADRLGALLFFHPAEVRFAAVMSQYHLRNLIGNPTETTVAMASLIFSGFLDRLPSLRMVFAHGGGYGCFAAGRFDHGALVRPEARGIKQRPSDYLRRMYFDNLLHSDVALRYLIDTVGIDRVVLGTDYPADMGPADPVGALAASSRLTGEEKDAVLGGNLSRLLGLVPR